MNQLHLISDCRELAPFPHIHELAIKKNTTIKLDSFTKDVSPLLRIYYVFDGKFTWTCGNATYDVYPGDMALVLPGISFGGEKDFLDIGTVGWLHLHLEKSSNDGRLTFGTWSDISKHERATIGKMLVNNITPVVPQLKEAGALMQKLSNELMHQEIGFVTRVRQLLDELIIVTARQLTRQTNSRRDFPKAFRTLEETLRANLAHQWTVEEMAAIVGLGTTAFSENVKNYTGFSPLNYLINIRISEAIRLLKKPEVHVTDIALDVGFYSSQHFATTFKKLTGYTPSQFRKSHIK
jgi:AraC-like DNA-binding protein